MENWEKLVIDPAHFAVLSTLEEEKGKEVLAEEAGLEEARLQMILQNLREEGLVQQEIESGKRKFSRNISDELDDLKEKLEADTFGGVREAIREGNFEEARKNISQELPLEGDARVNAARIEAAEKLESLI
jgi:predicted transcriptional regulator